MLAYLWVILPKRFYNEGNRVRNILYSAMVISGTAMFGYQHFDTSPLFQYVIQTDIILKNE